MSLMLALDQGTTSSRAILFDESGSIRQVAQKEFRQIFPQAGWVEHDPMEIWESQHAVALEVLHRAGASAGDVAGIGITNQRETTVVWDRKTGEPIHNAIVWQDRRTAGFCDQLRREGHLALVQQKTGLVIDAYFSGSKLRWLLDHVEGARRRAERGELAFGTIDTWLLWKLTNGACHITDASNASRTMLYNIHTRAWDDELLQLLKIPREVLPEVKSSSEVYGQTAAGVFDRALAVAGIAGDQQAALFGQTCFSRGLAKNTYGTGCFMLMNIGTDATASKHNLLTTVAWQLAGRTEYALEGGVFIGGAVVQWLRDGLGIVKSASEIEGLAASVADSGGVYMVPAFAGLARLLGPVRPRHDYRHHAPHQRGPHRPRGAGEHCLSGGRHSRCDATGRRRRDQRTARGWGRGRQQSAVAVSGRPAARAGGAAQSHGNDGAGRRLPCRVGRRLLEKRAGRQRQMGGRTRL